MAANATAGRLLIYAASQQPGAAVTASAVARRMGAGYTTIACPRDYHEFFATLQIGAHIIEYLDTAGFAQMIDDFAVNAVLIGPGSGVNIAVRERIISALKRNIAIILDSQGVLSFGNSLSLLKTENHQSALVLSITPDECARIHPNQTADNGHIAIQQLAVLTNAIIVQKSNPLTIADASGQLYTNPSQWQYSPISGNNDVLNGMISALCSIKMPPLSAVLMAAYCHGLAENKLGKGLICEDFSPIIPLIIKEVTQLCP